MKNAKILIVENERSVRQALRFELEDDGYEVLYASDYPEAVSAFRAFDCDVVISDIFLNRGDGIQLMNMVNKEKKEVPFIFITAFPDSELGSHIKTVLKDRLYEKPFFMPDLKQKVSELINERDSCLLV